MKNNPTPFNYDVKEDSFDLRNIFLNYKHHWPWIIATTVLSICIGFTYLHYAPISYESVAKIKIIDDSKELNVSTDALSLLSNTPKKTWRMK